MVQMMPREEQMTKVESNLYEVRHLGHVPARWQALVLARRPGDECFSCSILPLTPEEVVGLCGEGWASGVCALRPGTYEAVNGDLLVVRSDGTWLLSPNGDHPGQERLWRITTLEHAGREFTARVYTDGLCSSWQLWDHGTLLARCELSPISPFQAWHELLYLAAAVVAEVDEDDWQEE